MGLHKLPAGDGYTYLTRQVAAADDTNRGRGTLASYYEQKGESPGVWLGSGLESLHGSVPEFLGVGVVSEEQMFALFGLGRHPNDRAIIASLARDGASRRVQDAATKLGHAYHLFEPNAFLTALTERYREYDTERGARPGTPIAAAQRSRLRTELAREWFRAEHHHEPTDAREFTGYLTKVSRPAPSPVTDDAARRSPRVSTSSGFQRAGISLIMLWARHGNPYPSTSAIRRRPRNLAWRRARYQDQLGDFQMDTRQRRRTLLLPWQRCLLYSATGADMRPARGGADGRSIERRRKAAPTCRRPSSPL